MRGVVSVRLLGWLAMLGILVVALVVGASDDRGSRSPEDRARNIASSVGCPTCAGQSVAESDATASRGILTFIKERLAEGATDSEIRDELAARFGEEILLEPSGSGIAALVWALPVAAVVTAVAGIALAFYRWRRASTPTPASPADRVMVDAALNDSRAQREAKRLTGR